MPFHTLTEVDGVARLQALGRIVALNAADSDPFLSALGSNAYSLSVTLCLSRTSVLDSGAIGWLLASHRKFKQHNGRLVLHSLRGNVLAELKMLRLDKVLLTAENEDEAISLANGTEPPR